MALRIRRAAGLALLGFILGAAFLVLEYSSHPDLTFDMERDLPVAVLSGFYPLEVSPDGGFAWTREQAALNVTQFSRRAEWRCLVRFRGGRPAPIPQPLVTIAVDDKPAATVAATNDYQQVSVAVPAREAPGLDLTLTSSITFTPGASDRRALGVQVNRLSCRPAARAIVLPPSRAIVDAGLALAALGVVFGLIGLTTAGAIAATLLMAVLQAFPLSSGPAPYAAYDDWAVWVAIWVGAPTLLGVELLEWRRYAVFTRTSRVAAVFSASALYLKLLSLLHPSKAVADALYHTHRLDSVLAGNYFFTQTMPGGVQFPYAIALYVFAAPWTVFSSDHMAVLKVVMAASEAIAGLVLYWAIVKSWDDQLVAICALVLLHTVPVSYLVLFFANMANGFGQSAAIITMACALAWRLGARDRVQVLGLGVLAAVAFLSHITTLALLMTALIALAFLCWWGGGRPLAAQARSILIAAAVGLVLAIVLYYGRREFLPVYEGALRARSSDLPAITGETAAIRATSTLSTRVTDGLMLARDVLGWPLLVLACVGAWRIRAERRADRLVYALAAWGTSFAVFFLFAVAAPARVGRQRYALEFIGRATYAASPAVVVLAALGAVWAWRAGLLSRVAAACVVLYALVNTGLELMRWVR